MSHQSQQMSHQDQMSLLGKMQTSTRQIWLAGLGALAKSQEEGNELFESLAKEGENVENQMKKTAETQVEDVKGRIATAWDDLEKAFNERISGIMDRLGLSTKQDIQHVSEKLEEVDKKLDQNEHKGSQ